jgi:hypothetical protein
VNVSLHEIPPFSSHMIDRRCFYVDLARKCPVARVQIKNEAIDLPNEALVASISTHSSDFVVSDEVVDS